MFYGSHFGQFYRESPEEAGAMGQRPLMGKLPEGQSRGCCLLGLSEGWESNGGDS